MICNYFENEMIFFWIYFIFAIYVFFWSIFTKYIFEQFKNDCCSNFVSRPSHSSGEPILLLRRPVLVLKWILTLCPILSTKSLFQPKHIPVIRNNCQTLCAGLKLAERTFSMGTKYYRFIGELCPLFHPTKRWDRCGAIASPFAWDTVF